jgi:hypothetical protein
MTFLRWYGLGAVGLTMIITCLGVEVYLIFGTVCSFVRGSGDGELIVDLSALLQASPPAARQHRSLNMHASPRHAHAHAAMACMLCCTPRLAPAPA